MTSSIRTLIDSRELLYLLTWRDIRVRYKQSVMGFLWAILMPALIVGAGVLVRVAAGRYSDTPITPEDISSVMVRAVAWSFFIAAIRFGTNSLITNPNLVSKIAFPKEVFPISAVMSNLFDFCVATVAVVAAMVLLLDWVPGWTALLAFPLILLLIVFAIGVTLLLSSANLFFRDVKYLVEVLLTYAIFFTPVLYEVSMVGKWKNIIMLNPVAPVLEGLSATVVHGRVPEGRWIAYSIGVSLLTLVLGYRLFKRLEEKFAETI